MSRLDLSSPFSNSIVHILVALAKRDLHGYGIMQEIKFLSGGEYKMGPGTLYDNLRTLLSVELVAEFMEPSNAAEPRRMYHLTESGQAALETELVRLSKVVRAGRKRLSGSRPKEA